MVVWPVDKCMVTQLEDANSVALCVLANGKTSDKIQPGYSVACEQRKNIERFRINEVSIQIIQPVQ